MNPAEMLDLTAQDSSCGNKFFFDQIRLRVEINVFN
jgi:hypothetical protein